MTFVVRERFINGRGAYSKNSQMDCPIFGTRFLRSRSIAAQTRPRIKTNKSTSAARFPNAPALRRSAVRGLSQRATLSPQRRPARLLFLDMLMRCRDVEMCAHLAGAGKRKIMYRIRRASSACVNEHGIDILAGAVLPFSQLCNTHNTRAFVLISMDGGHAHALTTKTRVRNWATCIFIFVNERRTNNNCIRVQRFV